MQTLTLEHLAPYLPYGLQIMCYGSPKRLAGLTENQAFAYGIGWVDIVSNTKPILRPLSDLNKPIDHGEYKGINITKQYELRLFNNQWCDTAYAEYGETPISYTPVTEYNTFMFKFHFDVFGLIEQRLAIDINTL